MEGNNKKKKKKRKKKKKGYKEYINKMGHAVKWKGTEGM